MSFAKDLPQTLALLEAARGEVFPAYGVALWHQGRQWEAYGGGATATSIFDLASLTKVLSTTTLIALCEARGLFSTETPLQRFYPQFSDGRVRLSHLLDHSSGLPWWLPLHAHFHEERGPGKFDPVATPPVARAWYEREILKSHNPEDFEKQAVYSDLGFLLMGWILERETGRPLKSLFREWIGEPAGLASLGFQPSGPEIIPTEDCPWRGRVLRGEVHDDNCFVLGGAAGHAGLFGTTADTLAEGRLWLDAFQGRPSLIPEELARKFWKLSRVPGSTRALGWDSPSDKGSSAGTRMSPLARGHLGYTGTSLWLDPEKDLAVTLLTNRVYPSRTNEKIKAFRPIFHDTLLSELGLG